jgi:hypothetical protein
MKATAILLVALSLLAVTSTALAGAPRGSRANPYPVGTKVRLPGGTPWKLRVNKSIPNATRLVLNWNRYNPPPERGHQFFIVTVTLEYFGKGWGYPFAPTRFSAVGRANIAYSLDGDSCGSIPRQLNFGKRVASGGSLTGNLCFSVWKSDVGSLLLAYGTSPYSAKAFFRVR